MVKKKVVADKRPLTWSQNVIVLLEKIYKELESLRRDIKRLAK